MSPFGYIALGFLVGSIVGFIATILWAQCEYRRRQEQVARRRFACDLDVWLQDLEVNLEDR